MAKAPIPGQDLFAPLPDNLGNDLFAAPKVAPIGTTGGNQYSYAERAIYNAQKSKQLTKTQQAELDRNNQVNAVKEQLDAMRQSPEWQNASLDKRKSMFKDWQTAKWMPFLENIEDKKLRKSLDMLPYDTLQPDITNLQSTIKQSSRLGDTVEGLKATASQTLSGFADQLPAVNYQYTIDKIRAAQAKGETPGVLDTVGNPLESGTAGMPLDVIGKRIAGDSWDDILKYATEQRDLQLKEAGESKKYQDAAHAAQSIGQIDRERELQEDIAKRQTAPDDEWGAFKGTAANLLAHPSNALQLATEQAPNIVPGVVSALGGPVGAALGSAALSGQDAMSSAIQQVDAVPTERLATLPAYKELAAQGLPEQEIRKTLALRAGQDAQLYGSLVGLATGPLGAEAGAGRIITRTLGGEAIADAATGGVARTVGRNAARGATQLATEGIEEGGTQAAANLGQNTATGDNVNLSTGVGQAAAQGIAAAAPLAGANTMIETVSALRQSSTPTTPEGGEPASTGGTNEDTVAATPTAAEAAAQEAATASAPGTDAQPSSGTPATPGEGTATVTPADVEGAPAPAPAPAPATSATTLAELRPVFVDARSRAGTAFDATEANTFIDTLLDAEANGVDNLRIQLALEKIGTERGVSPGLGYTSILDGYKQRRAERLNNEASSLAEDLTNTGDQNGRTEQAGDTRNAPTSDSINSDIEAIAAESQQAGPEISTVAEPATPVTEVTGPGRTASDSTAENGGNANADETLGAVADASTADSGFNNQSVSDAGTPVSARERSELDSTGQRAADGRSTERSEASPARSDTGVANAVNEQPLVVGDTVTYNSPSGAAPITGQVVAVNPDGTVNIGVNDGVRTTTYANRPAEYAQRIGDTTNAGVAAPDAAPQVESAPVAETAPQGVSATDVTPAVVGQPARQDGQDTLGPDVSVLDNSQAGMAEAQLTPSGYSVTDLNSKADKLSESDSEHQGSGIDMMAALEQGDYAKADQIAQYLYEAGLRQFTPPQESTGRARTTVNQAFMNDLSPAERLASQREFADLRDQNALPPEASTFQGFRDTLTQDAMQEAAGQPALSDLWQKVSEGTRNIMRKLAKALAIVVMAISINQMTPINDAMAAQTGSTVHTVQQVQGLSKSASAVNSWIQEHHDNAKQSYIIADKQSGEIHIIGADGKVKATAPALFGRKQGDGMSLGETPAGVFTIKHESAPSSYGGDLQQFASAPNGDVYAIHRVLTTNPKQNRLGRLASPSAADNRISLGCINIPVDVYNKYLSGSFKGKLYVLPDQRSLGDMFQGINDTAAKQNLTEGQQLPQDLAAPTNAQFRSSTPTIAQRDLAPATPTANPVKAKPAMEYGAAITDAAAQADESTATSELAAQTNSPADQTLWGAAMFPFFAFRRNQTRAQKGKPGALPDETLPPDEPERTVSDKDYHKVTAALDDQSTVVSDQPRLRSGALGDLMRKAAYKLSDTHVYFINWMNDTGLTRGYAEYDDHPAIQLLKSQTNRTRNRTKALYDQHLKPVYDFVASVHDRTGRNIDIVAQELGSIKTFYHIIEANRELRRSLQNNLDEVYLTGTEAEVQQAEASLRAFDQAQAGQITVQQLRETSSVGGLAGGLTDAQARAGIARLSAKYRPEDVAQFRALTRQAVSGMVDARLRGDPETGVRPSLTPEDVAAWDAHGFQDYVPLYVNHEQEDGANDIYLGTSNFNPVGDYTRKGSVTAASHSMVTLQQFLYRTAAGLESQPFKDQIHSIYVNAADKNALGGLKRVNLNDARMNPQGEFFNKEIYAARGLNYAVRGTDAEGNQTITRYKYYWDNDKVADGLFHRNGEPDWKVAIPTTITGTFGKFMTKYNPLFPWKTMWRDAGERTRTIAAKQIIDTDGNVIPATRLYTQLTAATHNPIHPLNLGLYFASGGRLAANTATVKAYKELQTLGGVSTYQDALAKSLTNMRSQIRSMRGLRKYAKQLDSFFTHYNEALAAAPAVGGYLALQNMKVDNRTAAARSLDVMNASNKGEWTQRMSMLYPFIAPTFEGGRNLLRNLSTTRGRVIFAANTMTSIALYGMLYSLAAGYGDDDDNPLDKLALDDMANYIPLVMGENNIIKIPVAFGQSRISWVLGAGLARMSQGVDNPGKVAGSVTAALMRELQPLEYESKIASDNIMAGLALTAMPSIAKPMAEVGFNINHFGSPIHSPKPDAGYASDAARASTPEVWTDIAKAVESISGFDAFPESYRHLASGYMVGPLRGIMTALESGSQYQAGGNLTARQELGPVWDAVGVGQFWDNGSKGVSTQYYQYQDKADDVFRKYHVPKSAPGTSAGEGGIDARDRVLKAGGTIQEAMLVQYAKEAESERSAMNRDLKQQLKGMKAHDIDLEVLAPQYEVHQRNQEQMMRRFIRQARGLQE